MEIITLTAFIPLFAITDVTYLIYRLINLTCKNRDCIWVGPNFSDKLLTWNNNSINIPFCLFFFPNDSQVSITKTSSKQ